MNLHLHSHHQQGPLEEQLYVLKRLPCIKKPETNKPIVQVKKQIITASWGVNMNKLVV